MAEIVNIPINMIYPHPDNPRKDLGDLSELVESIKLNGIMQNLTVVRAGERYRALIGHRRHAAAKLAGLTEVPCAVVEMSPQEQIGIMLAENMQRSDLTTYEQAQGFQMMLDMGETVESISEKVGFSQNTVRRRVKLLELNDEELRKAEARGATLFEYAELDKIKSIELKNKVLESAGTANFNNELKRAIDEERFAERLEKWKNDIAAFATEIEKSGYVGETETPMAYVRNYGRWSNKGDTAERPEDADTVNYYYRVGKDEIDLYKDLQEHVETAEERQLRERREEQKQIEDELGEITDRHFSLRSEFVADFSAAKKNLPSIVRYALGVIIGDGRYSYNEVDEELVDELLDLDVRDSTDYMDFKAAVEKYAAEKPEYALLVCAYARVDDCDMGYWDRRWDQEEREWQIIHKKNGDLDRLYDFLVSLGYEMSDEEKAMQNGTHELLQQAEE